MHIVLFTLNMAKGGTERVISNLCNEYLVKKYQVSIVTFYPVQCCYEIDRNIHMYSLEIKQKRNSLGKLLDIRKVGSRYVEVMSEIQPDIVLAFLPRPSLMACIMKKKVGVPVIGSIRSNPEVNFPTPIYRFLARRILAKADGFVFQTEEARQFFPFSLQQKSEVIMNPVSEEAIRVPYGGKREKRIVSVGRFTEEKNYPLLIRAFARLDLVYQDYQLWIYGKEERKLHLKELVQTLHITDRVVFAGQVDCIYDEIYYASLFVMSSKSEGMPNALMEAMAMGLPVIATDCPCGGPRALIQSGENGVLVENDNEDALVRAMNEMLGDHRKAARMGERAADIKEKCSGQRIYGEWERYILSVFKKEDSTDND